jgi:hypothetical protein
LSGWQSEEKEFGSCNANLSIQDAAVTAAARANAGELSCK